MDFVIIDNDFIRLYIMVFSKTLKTVSNPTTVRRKAKQIFGSAVKIVESRAKGKKYALIRPDGRRVNFGSIDYEECTKHGSDTRRNNYLKRAKGIKGNWKDNKYSANNKVYVFYGMDKQLRQIHIKIIFKNNYTIWFSMKTLSYIKYVAKTQLLQITI
jgi:hypothetical protein